MKRCDIVKQTGVPYSYNATKWSRQLTLDRHFCMQLGYSKNVLIQRITTYALGNRFERH